MSAAVHDRLDVGTTHPLTPEASTVVHELEEILVFFAPEPVEPCNLKITPEVAPIVDFSFHGLVVDIWQSPWVGYVVRR